MIRAVAFYEDEVFRSLTIKGHGDPLVCSAVSAILIGSCNAFIFPERFDIRLISGDSSIVKNDIFVTCLFDNIVIDTLLAQLSSIGKKYPNELKVQVSWQKGSKKHVRKI